MKTVCSLMCLPLAMAIFAGCADDERRVLPSATAGAGASVPCTDGVQAPDALLLRGAWPVVVGTVASVEVVRDAFWRAADGGTVSAQACASWDHADVALRVTLAVENASWTHTTNDEVVVALHSHAFATMDAQPSWDAQRQSVVWSDGNKYLQPGDRIGAIGGFTDDGGYFATARNLFEVTSAGTIAGFAQRACVSGTLNGQSSDAVVALATKGSDGTRPMMQGTVPQLTTRCND